MGVNPYRNPAFPAPSAIDPYSSSYSYGTSDIARSFGDPWYSHPHNVPNTYASPSFAQAYLNRLESYFQSPVDKFPLPKHDDIAFPALSNKCVLLGKKSSVSALKKEDIPFGFEALREAIAVDQRSALLQHPLTVETKLQVRSRCPSLIEGSAYYGRIEAELLPGDNIVLKEIYELNYADDTFYWASIDHASKGQ